MLLYSLLAFICSGLIAISIFGSLLSKNIDFGLIAPPNIDVSTHNAPIPLIGGIVIFVSFFIPFIVISVLYNLDIWIYLIGFLPLGTLGLYKDRFQQPVSSFKQLVPQLLTTIILYYYWCNINQVSFSWTTFVIISSVFCIIMNGFNFLDVMDGLAASILLSMLVFIGIAGVYFENTAYTLVVSSLIGSLVAFLKYNWWPAKLFLGDFGAFGLIYSTLFISISIYPHNSIKHPVGYIFVFFMLFFEFFFTIVRRLKMRKLPYLGDNNHISLTLLNKGIKSTAIVVGATICALITNLIAIYFLFN